MSHPPKIQYFKYVRHADKAAFEALGWIFDNPLGPPHGFYAALYRWPHASPPILPQTSNDFPEIRDYNQLVETN